MISADFIGLHNVDSCKFNEQNEEKDTSTTFDYTVDESSVADNTENCVK